MYVGRITWDDGNFPLLTAWVRVNFSTFNFGENRWRTKSVELISQSNPAC
jgi:hypothetical protein